MCLTSCLFVVQNILACLVYPLTKILSYLFQDPQKSSASLTPLTALQNHILRVGQHSLSLGKAITTFACNGITLLIKCCTPPIQIVHTLACILLDTLLGVLETPWHISKNTLQALQSSQVATQKNRTITSQSTSMSLIKTRKIIHLKEKKSK